MSFPSGTRTCYGSRHASAKARTRKSRSFRRQADGALVAALFPVLQALVDLRARDAEQLGRLALVAARLLERGMDRALLELGDGQDLLHAEIVVAEGRRAADERRVVQVALAHHAQARHLVAQLAHVAGPRA